MERVSLRFVRWGAGLLVIGLLTGYLPLGHYLMGGVKVPCPASPVHAHVAVLGWIAFTLFGLVYRALPDWGSLRPSSVKLATVHLWLSLVAVLGVWINGTMGYRLIDAMSPRFYYKPDQAMLRLWLEIDGGFLTLFAVGCCLFIWVLYGVTGRQVTREPRA
jgi:cbb3-type cytochrome oxidase subunit 1